MSVTSTRDRDWRYHHNDLPNYDSHFREDDRAGRVAMEVGRFLQELFADRLLFWRSIDESRRQDRRAAGSDPVYAAGRGAAMDQPDRCVFVANGQMQAEQVRSFLASADIASELRGEALSKTHGLTLDGLGRVEVRVAAEDEARALALLASAEAGELTIDEDFDSQS